jgi:hypothetical protein
MERWDSVTIKEQKARNISVLRQICQLQGGTTKQSRIIQAVPVQFAIATLRSQ